MILRPSLDLFYEREWKEREVMVEYRREDACQPQAQRDLFDFIYGVLTPFV
jgi:hypothetical protein